MRHQFGDLFSRFAHWTIAAGLFLSLVAPASGQSGFYGQEDASWLASRLQASDEGAVEELPPEPQVPPVPQRESLSPEQNDVALPVTEQLSGDELWQEGCQSCGPTCGPSAGSWGWERLDCGRRCCSQGGLCNGQCRHTRIYRAFYLGRLWFDYETLAWSTKSQYVPPLVTTSTNPADQGILGRETTIILAGDETMFDQLQVGGRLTGGWWFDPDQCSGVELNYFVLDGENLSFQTAAYFTDAVLARPFTDVLTGLQDSELINPTTYLGDVRAEVDMQFSGASALYRRVLVRGCQHRLDFVGGYRYLRLDDRLRVSEDIVRDTGLYRSGERFDQFRSESEFHGGELGLIGRWQKGSWSLELVGKGAIGSSHRNVLINGRSTLIDVNGDASNYDSSVLAQPSNIGSYTDDDLAFTSELGVSLQYDITCQFRASVGYTFLYWSEVSRALDHVSLSVDPTLIPPPGGTASNTFEFVNDDFWAQGLTAGFEYQF